LCAALYAGLALAAIAVSRQPGSIAVVWLANGAATALIVSAPPARSAAMLMASMAAGLGANLAHGDPWTVSLAFVAANASEIGLAVVLVRRFASAETMVHEHQSFVRTITLGALLPPLLGASVGALALDRLGFGDFSRVWVDWYVGGALGGVAMIPLVLSARTGSFADFSKRMLDQGALGVLLLLPLAVVLTLKATIYPFVALCVGLLALTFLRSRIVIFAATPLVVATIALALALGWYQPLTPDTPAGRATVYLAVLLVVLPGQVVTVVLARQRAYNRMLVVVGSRDDDILTFVDTGSVLRWANATRERYRGVPNREVIGRSLRELHAVGQLADTALGDHAEALAGRTVHAVREVNYPTLGLRTMAITQQPARDEDGQPFGVISSARDITELANQRRELAARAESLRAANERLEQFVRIASHDLREPLNTISQFVGLLPERPGFAGDAEARLYLDQVEVGTRRMKNMLDYLLAFVSLDQAPPGPVQPVDLDALLAEVRAALGAQLAASGGEIASVAPLGHVPGHATLLSLLMQNLLSNALKFMPPGRAPRVRVEAERQGNELCLSVADNGIGIEAGRLAEIGEPFRRLHARRKYEGTGLGLAICKRIAQLHGGQLEITSMPGEGSRFSVVLPLHAPA
jgi:PAS domain S-box-containing protein